MHQELLQPNRNIALDGNFCIIEFHNSNAELWTTTFSQHNKSNNCMTTVAKQTAGQSYLVIAASNPRGNRDS